MVVLCAFQLATILAILNYNITQSAWISCKLASEK